MTTAATVETPIRPNGTEPLVYGVVVDEGIVHVGSTLIAPSGETANVERIVLLADGELHDLEGASSGLRVVLHVSPVVALYEGEKVTFS